MLLEDVQHVVAWPSSEQGNQPRHIPGRDALEPLVLAIVAYDRGARPEILTVDVQRALAIEVRQEVTAIPPLVFIPQNHATMRPFRLCQAASSSPDYWTLGKVKAFAAPGTSRRVLGINKGKLARYILAGIVRTTRSGKLERIADEELQRHLVGGLLEFPDEEPAPSSRRRRTGSRRSPRLVGNMPQREARRRDPGSANLSACCRTDCGHDECGSAAAILQVLDSSVSEVDCESPIPSVACMPLERVESDEPLVAELAGCRVVRIRLREGSSPSALWWRSVSQDERSCFLQFLWSWQ